MKFDSVIVPIYSSLIAHLDVSVSFRQISQEDKNWESNIQELQKTVKMKVIIIKGKQRDLNESQ